MKMSLIADFRLYKKEPEKTNIFKQLTKDDIDDLSVGGFAFVVNGNSVPFDWDAHSCSEENGVFHLETGWGPFFNDFEIPKYWDEEYAEMGLAPEQITAEFLASTTEVEEFYISVFDEEADDDTGIGNNTDANAEFYIELLAISIEERETGDSYDVDEAVIKAFNGNISDYTEFLSEAYSAFRKEWYASQEGIDVGSECLGYTKQQFEENEFIDVEYMSSHYPDFANKKLLCKN